MCSHVGAVMVVHGLMAFAISSLALPHFFSFRLTIRLAFPRDYPYCLYHSGIKLRNGSYG